MEPQSTPPPLLLSGKKVAVVGAGISCLAFVKSLQKQWPQGQPFPEIIIYERDAQDAVGREGYSISIRGDALSGGMQALEKMGLLDHALNASLTGSQRPEERGSFGVWDPDWNRLLEVGRPKCDTNQVELGMRIARDSLRRVLLDSVLESNSPDIRWSTQCVKVEKVDGKVQLHLNDGKTDVCDLVIACDGANSKIRECLRPDDKLSYAGAVMIIGTARFPEGQVPAPANKDWGLVLGGKNGVGLFVSPIDSSSAVWSLSYMAPEPRERINPPMPKEQLDNLIQEVLDRGTSFTEPFQTLVRATDPSTLRLFNAMDKQPFQHSHCTDVPVIFIGDSNHAMSPFAGNGANMALLDGWDLAEQLCRAQSLESALEAYDKSSIGRSQNAIAGSRWAISMGHATGFRLFGYGIALKLASLIMALRG
ncbi:hypothetical protein D8B26_002454 [Coccidioides posadasii str. Silveira]|uniref:FAD-binding domain-containing protein n=2 Tax=Coccidioides posadasii TaxID=199306 RepID=E9DHE8_COCPS|nr:conserved hypothetical protein [Coccidioides posadasii str. Silveira]KMM65892.1 hypothetical protein CPAG_02233 [Coccidioides posadasii RMSCC 3488]QVM07763.1 hypothetical protein D8B26_002454 [Coccidioides posadasii str. Silveira]